MKNKQGYETVDLTKDDDIIEIEDNTTEYNWSYMNLGTDESGKLIEVELSYNGKIVEFKMNKEVAVMLSVWINEAMDEHKDLI